MDGSLESNKSDFFFSPLVIKDENGNVIHRINETQKQEWNEQTFYLNKVSELADPITINIPTNKSVYVDIEVWDYDGDQYQFQFVRSIKGLDVPFKEKMVSSSFSLKRRYSSPNAEASLRFKYKILECDEGFTGLGCNYCVKGWTGESCSQCANNYYPAQQCTKFCEPESDRYSCSPEGQIQCSENREGDKCEKCRENFHGNDCLNFCEESISHYCSELAGNKVCKAHYYPESECTNFCEETLNYSCNEQGKRICKDFFYPDGECTVWCKESLNYTCDRYGFKVCNSHQFPAESCSIFCQANKDYTCSLQGSKVCNDETADPEKDCKKANIVVYAGIGGGVAVFLILISLITWVCRRNIGEKDENTERGLDKNEIYYSLDVGVEDSTVRNIQREPLSPGYIDLNQEYINARKQEKTDKISKEDEVYDTLDDTLEHTALETKKESMKQTFSEKVDVNQGAGKEKEKSKRSYSEYIDMNPQYTNTEADVRIHNAEDTDVVYSTLNQKNVIPHAFQADPDDFLYSTLHGKDVINAPKGLPTTGMNGDGDTLYSTLHGKDDLYAKADSKPHGHDDAGDDDNYDVLFSNIGKREDDHLNVNADDVYAKLDRGNATCSNIHPTSPDRAETADCDYATSSEHDQKKDDNDDEPVYSVVNKEEVGIFNKRKDVTNSILYDHSTPGFPPSERITFSAESDEVSGTVITDQNSAVTYENQEQNLQDSSEDPSYLYSTVNK